MRFSYSSAEMRLFEDHYQETETRVEKIFKACLNSMVLIMGTSLQSFGNLWIFIWKL